MIKIYIYKLIKKDATNDDMVYIGSTNNITIRFQGHKDKCNNPKSIKYNTKVYKYIRENGGINEWELVILDELYVYYDKCKKRYNYESKFINAYDAINKLNSRKEYGLCNAEKKVCNKKYYINNREIINEKRLTKIKCEICNSLINTGGLWEHNKSIKCKSKLNI
jgi:hypothetical protein